MNPFCPLSDRSGESASDHHESPRTSTVRHLSTSGMVRALHPSPSKIPITRCQRRWAMRPDFNEDENSF